MPWQPIDQLAAAEKRLGTATAEFRYSFWHYVWRLGQCGLGIAVGGFLIFLAVQMSADGWAFPILLSVFALGTFGGSGYVIYRTLAWPHLHVMVFPAGLLRIERDRFNILYWGQVESVWQQITIHLDNTPGLPGRRTHVYTVKLAEGEKVVFKDNIRDVVELGEIIAEETTRRLLPKALKKYNDGGEVTFGKWSVSQAGLKYYSKTIPWQTIGKVHVLNGTLIINQRGKLLPLGAENMKDIPNVDVLLELLEALRGESTERE